MRLSSFRLTLLDFAARVLSRWLNAVTARIDAQPPVQPVDSPARTSDNPPPPPDHWVEMVRQRAPQLLDPNAEAGFGVIDYRADDALVEPQVFTPQARTPKSRPVSVITPRHPAAAPVPTVKTTPKRHPRPLRLNNVTTQPLEVTSIDDHSAQTGADALEIPTTRSETLNPAQPSIRRPAEVEAGTLPVRDDDPLPAEPSLSPHFPDLPVEQHIREVHTSFADVPEVPSVRTSAGSAKNVNQRRTSVPIPPEQTVLRTSVHQTAQTVRENAYNLWASLPESAPEDVYNPNAEQNHRARLKREQEGRSWSE